MVGIQDNFYSKSKRFCKMECSKKYSALFQKKGPGTRHIPLSVVNGRMQKRKMQRPAMRLKKVRNTVIKHSLRYHSLYNFKV